MNETKLASFESLTGHTLQSVVNEGDERIVFTLENGDKYMLYHEQDCCERVEVEDISGDLQDLIGMPILLAEEVSKEGDAGYDHETWTFYKLATNRGYVTIRWYGTSNGYYSEGVDWSAC